jgi:hypothetical protein
MLAYTEAIPLLFGIVLVDSRIIVRVLMERMRQPALEKPVKSDYLVAHYAINKEPG